MRAAPAPEHCLIVLTSAELQRSAGQGSGSLSEYRSVNRTLCPLEDYVGTVRHFRPSYHLLTSTTPATTTNMTLRWDDEGDLGKELGKEDVCDNSFLSV